MEQIFLNEVCKFYSRTAKGTKPVPVYASIKVGGERIVIPTKVKVIPSQFNVKAQTAVVSNMQTELDNLNNKVVNDTIKFYKEKFNEFISFLRNNLDGLDNIRETIYNFVPMKKKETKRKFSDTLEYILNSELERQLKEHKITETWAVTKRSNIKKFIDFLSIRKISNEWSSLNNKTYNDYKEYLLNEFVTPKGDTLKISAINQALSSLKSIVSCVNERDELPYIENSRWKLVENRLTIDEKKSGNIVFEESDLQKIMDLKLSGTEEIIRDIFVFGCQVGQRPADCIRILRGEFKQMTSNGIEVISILPHKTRRTNKEAFIPVFNPSIVYPIMEKFTTIDEYKDFLCKTDIQRNSLNSKYIKSIFEKAGLNGEVSVTEQRGNEIVTVIKKQNETAHIYLARHYFITLCFINKLPAEKVIEITGHTTTKQVNETYSHLSAEQKADRLTGNETIQKLVKRKMTMKRSDVFEEHLFLKKETDYEKLTDEGWDVLKKLTDEPE